MSVEAFARTLPAYLTALVRGTQNEFPVLVLSQLTRQPGYFDKFDARLAALTAPQRDVVTRVLGDLARESRLLTLYPDAITAAAASWQAPR